MNDGSNGQSSPLVFLDTETTGLHAQRDHIWEIAAVRRLPDGSSWEWQVFVEHDLPSEEYLASDFAADYKARYDASQALTREEAVEGVRRLFEGRAHMVGMCPFFDAERLGVMRRLAGFDEPDPWHYHLIDVEPLAVGYLAAQTAFFRNDYDSSIEMPIKLPWDSDMLSREVGVEPPGDGERHTAMGDVRWTMAVYDAVMGGAA